MESMWFDDVEVGQQWTSQGRTVTESDVCQFASATGDFNPLHVDHDFASKGPYRKPIAHGLLGLSWVAGLGSTAPLMRTVAFTSVRSWEFLLPIYFGDTVHVETECLEKLGRGRKAGQIRWKRKLINQKGQTVQQGQFETLVSICQKAERGDLTDPVAAVEVRIDAVENGAKPNLFKGGAVKNTVSDN
jgi:acyl dehydratase